MPLYSVTFHILGNFQLHMIPSAQDWYHALCERNVANGFTGVEAQTTEELVRPDVNPGIARYQSRTVEFQGMNVLINKLPQARMCDWWP